MHDLAKLAEAYTRRALIEAGKYGAASDSGYGAKFLEVAALFAIAKGLRELRDSDGSPEGRDAQRLDGEAATARCEAIAQDKGLIS